MLFGLEVRLNFVKRRNYYELINKVIDILFNTVGYPDTIQF